MTKDAYRREVRQQYEGFSGYAQSLIAAKALGREVFAWDCLTTDELDALVGTMAVVRLVTETFDPAGRPYE